MATSHTTLRALRAPGLVGGASATQVGNTNFRAFAKLVSLSICNTSSVAITATVYVLDNASTQHRLVYNLPIAVGATTNIAGPGSQFSVLNAGDSVWASIAGAGGTADITMSIEERTE